MARKDLLCKLSFTFLFILVFSVNAIAQGPPDKCDGVVCQDVTTTCGDGFVASCTPTCDSKTGKCGSCTPDCTGHEATTTTTTTTPGPPVEPPGQNKTPGPPVEPPGKEKKEEPAPYSSPYGTPSAPSKPEKEKEGKEFPELIDDIPKRLGKEINKIVPFLSERGRALGQLLASILKPFEEVKPKIPTVYTIEPSASFSLFAPLTYKKIQDDELFDIIDINASYDEKSLTLKFKISKPISTEIIVTDSSRSFQGLTLIGNNGSKKFSRQGNTFTAGIINIQQNDFILSGDLRRLPLNFTMQVGNEVLKFTSLPFVVKLMEDKSSLKDIIVAEKGAYNYDITFYYLNGNVKIIDGVIPLVFDLRDVETSYTEAEIEYKNGTYLSRQIYISGNILAKLLSYSRVAIQIPAEKGLVCHEWNFRTEKCDGEWKDVENLENVELSSFAWIIEKSGKETTLLQGKAIVNQPVEWIKRVKLESKKLDTEEIPGKSKNVRVKSPTKTLNASAIIKGERKSLEDVEALEVEEDIVISIEEEVDKYEIEYRTPGPKSIEKKIDGHKKQINIFSEIPYENVTAFANITESRAEDVKLYWVRNSSRQLIDFIKNDTNKNGLIDRLEWLVPSTGNQTYEVEIIILNPVTFLRDNETWVVAFNTTGTADLVINSTNAQWEEIQIDLPETRDEMRFINLTCGGTLIEKQLVIIDDKGKEINYNKIKKKDSIKPENFLVRGYSCENKTSHLYNFMNKAGYAVLQFTFGDQTAFASDPITAIDFISPTPANLTVITVGTTFINVSVANTTAMSAVLMEWTNSTNNTVNVTLYNTSSLVGLWHLDRNYTAADNATLDYSGKGNHGGDVNGVNCSVSVAGYFGGACKFDGNNDYVDALSVPDITTGGTFAMWIKPSALPGSTDRDIISTYYQETQSEQFTVHDKQFFINSLGTVKFRNWDGTSDLVASQSTVLVSQWYHIVATIDGSNIRMYFNGTLEGTTASGSSFDYANPAFRIAGLPDEVADGETTRTRFNGTIDEVSIWERSLSADEIKMLYKSQIGKYQNENVYHFNITKLEDGTHKYRAYARQTDGASNSTANRTLCVVDNTGCPSGADTTLPQFSSNSTNSTMANTFVNFTITVTDDTGLSAYNFETNNTGTRVNSSFVSFSGTSATAWNVTTLNSTVGTLVQWRFYANDTSNNFNASQIFNLTTTAAPQFSNNYTNFGLSTAYAKDKNYGFQITGSDDSGTYNATLETNITGSIRNYTQLSTPAVRNGTGTLANVWSVNFTDAAAGNNYYYRFYLNDTSPLWNSTEQIFFNITKASQTYTFTIDSQSADIARQVPSHELTVACSNTLSGISDATFALNRDNNTQVGTGTSISASQSLTSSATAYKFLCNTTQSTLQNYSYFALERQLTVNKGVFNASYLGVRIDGAEADVTVTYENSSTVLGFFNSSYAGDATFRLYRGIADTTSSDNNTAKTYAVGSNVFRYGVDTDAANWTKGNSTARTLTVNAKTVQVSLNNVNNITYPNLAGNTSNRINCGAVTVASTANTCVLFRNGTDVTSAENNTVFDRDAALYNITVTGTASTSNYSNNATGIVNFWFNIAKNTTRVALTLSSSTVTYPTETTATGSESNKGDSDVTYRLYREIGNDTGSTAETNTFGAGTHLYRFNATSGNNWSVNATGETLTLTVNRGNPQVKLFLNGTEGNRAYDQGAIANLTARTSSNPSDPTVNILTNYTGASVFTQIASTATSVTNLTNTNNLNTVNYSVIANVTGNANWTDNATGVNYFFKVNAVNTAPTIRSITTPSSPLTYSPNQLVNFTVIVDDADNGGDIDNATIEFNSTAPSVSSTLTNTTNTSVIRINSSANFYEFTFRILPGNASYYARFITSDGTVYTNTTVQTYTIDRNSSQTYTFTIDGSTSAVTTTYENTSTVACSNTLDGIRDATFALNRDNVTQIGTGTSISASQQLGASGTAYKFLCNTTQSTLQNYSYFALERQLTVNTKTVQVSLNGINNITYPNVNITVNCGSKGIGNPEQTKCELFRNNTNVTTGVNGNNTVMDLAAGLYEIKANGTTQSSNYSANATGQTIFFNIALNTTKVSLSISPSSTVTYPTETTATGSEANKGDSDVTYRLYREIGNDTGSTSEANTFGAGTHLYRFNASSGNNWSVNATGETLTLTVSKGSAKVRLQLNGTEGDRTYTRQSGIFANITGFNNTLTGNTDVQARLYSNYTSAAVFAELTATGTTVRYNATEINNLAAASYVVKANLTGNANWTDNSTGVNYTLTVEAVNAAPQFSNNYTNFGLSTVYAKDKNYGFQITGSDDSGTYNATLETNITGSIRNYTQLSTPAVRNGTGTLANVWSVNFTDAAAGNNYYYRFYLNDTASSPLWNSTNQGFFSIDKASQTYTFTIDSQSADIAGKCHPMNLQLHAQTP